MLDRERREKKEGETVEGTPRSEEKEDQSRYSDGLQLLEVPCWGRGKRRGGRSSRGKLLCTGHKTPNAATSCATRE